MYAAALGSVESMSLLLDAGADPNAANDFAATPLWCAGDAAKVRLLLSKGADVNGQKVDNSGDIRQLTTDSGSAAQNDGVSLRTSEY